MNRSMGVRQGIGAIDRRFPAVLASVATCLGLALGTWAVQSAETALSGDRVAAQDGEIIIHPVNHASLVLGYKQDVIYVDPVGGARRYQGLPRPTLILITDIHSDHLDPATLSSLAGEQTPIVAPKAVVDKLGSSRAGRPAVLRNGESKTVGDIQLQAVPMYNTTPDRLKYHEKGRGNGYVLTLGGKRIYISGDTEDIPEMRALKNIDVAFLCMNLPYTMTVEQAASAVREFKPKIVYPYHYRGSDLKKFQQLVGSNSGTEVRLRDWYR
jgi:L-ascorbate metabolism protein UlaG (beta-lactamase superfamily)